jgi:hypothetical protein
MTKLFYHGDKHVPMKHVYNMLLLISEGMTGTDEEVDNQIRKYAVLYYIDFLEKHNSRPVPASLERVIAWILGEYRCASSLDSIDTFTTFIILASS